MQQVALEIQSLQRSAATGTTVLVGADSMASGRADSGAFNHNAIADAVTQPIAAAATMRRFRFFAARVANTAPSRLVGAQRFRFRTERGRTDQILLLSSLLLYAFCARFDMFRRMPCKYFLARLNWLLDVFKSIPNCSAISLCLYPSITYMLNTIPYPLGSCAMAVANSSRVKSNSLNASKSAGVAWTSSTSS